MVQTPYLAHGGSERQILRKEMEPGPWCCRASKKPGLSLDLGLVIIAVTV